MNVTFLLTWICLRDLNKIDLIKFCIFICFSYLYVCRVDCVILLLWVISISILYTPKANTKISFWQGSTCEQSIQKLLSPLFTILGIAIVKKWSIIKGNYQSKTKTKRKGKGKTTRRKTKQNAKAKQHKGKPNPT